MIKEISILGGFDKEGKRESVEKIDIRSGEIIAIVGTTGSGKTRLISDIEQHAYGETPTGRKILVNGMPAFEYFISSGKRQFVGQVSQNMNFVMDIKVGEFLKMHAECRETGDTDDAVVRVLEAANELSGEPFCRYDDLTTLSGGQSRALMIADVALISNVDIVLMDEIENAGIDRIKAFNLLTNCGKISVTSTHDPLLSFMADRRIVMSNGGIKKVLESSVAEKELLNQLLEYDTRLQRLRAGLRSGEQI